MKRLALVGFLLFALTSCAGKENFTSLADGPCSANQKSAITEHVSAQLQAFAKEDWKKAFSFSSKSFQSTFTLDDFTAIIENDYSVLVSNQGYTFGQCSISNEEILQGVEIKLPNSTAAITYQLSVEEQQLGIIAARFTNPEDALAA
jgi:predicted component of type VI protein secretion system